MIGPDSDNSSKNSSEDFLRKRPSFEEEQSQEDHQYRDPRQERRQSYTRERMVSRYEEEDPEEGDEYERRSRFVLPSFGRLFGDTSYTTLFTYGAAGIGAILVILIGGWMLLRSQHGGIPVFAPPEIAVKQKPANPGGMQTIGMGTLAPVDSNSKATLLPGPEQANPDALAQQFSPQTPTPSTGTSNGGENTTTANDKPAQPLPSTDDKIANKTYSATEQVEDSNDRSEMNTAAPKVEEKPKVAKENKIKPNQEKTIKKESSTADTEPVSDGKYGVQLASLLSREAAKAEWQHMRHLAPDLLGSYTPLIQQAEVKGKKVYRLRIKGFASHAQASRFCAKLSSKKIACTLANF